MKTRSWSYIPVIRTRDAELKGFREVSTDLVDAMLPVVEITRSRRSKTNANGSIQRSLDSVLEILGEREFIADLTSLESQQNSELKNLLDPTNGFENWVEYVEAKIPRNCIPNIHLTDPFVADEFKRQLVGLSKTHSQFALRFPTSYDAMMPALKEYMAERGDVRGLVVLLDAGFVRPNAEEGAYGRLTEMCSELKDLKIPLVASIASSFPNSVVAEGYGKDTQGSFRLCEVALSKKLQRAFKNLVHGDYACIHPVDFSGTVTNWVPRVDVPLDDQVFYYRYRRDDGSYEKAARLCLRDEKYVPISCWAERNIKAAAKGEPFGKSPSHWISVRLNMHIHRQLMRLSG